jgi:hypothetical protein
MLEHNTYNDSALNPQVSLLKKPYLNASFLYQFQTKNLSHPIRNNQIDASPEGKINQNEQNLGLTL